MKGHENHLNEKKSHLRVETMKKRADWLAFTMAFYHGVKSLYGLPIGAFDTTLEVPGNLDFTGFPPLAISRTLDDFFKNSSSVIHLIQFAPGIIITINRKLI